MQIKRLAKFQRRNPAKNPKRPLPRRSNIFGKEKLNWLVRNMYDMPYKIKKDAIAVANIVKALPYGVSPAPPTIEVFAIIGPRKIAK